jgi:esterase/lipase
LKIIKTLTQKIKRTRTKKNTQLTWIEGSRKKISNEKKMDQIENIIT